jgi:murein DD-endopeptidase MepM/ murein hydrolase activator NlpD
MREYQVTSVAAAARIAAVVGVLALGAGCSAEVTRLSQPFFSDAEVTGSLPPIPKENVGAHAASTAPVTPVATAPYTPAPVAASGVAPSARASADIAGAAGNGFSMVQAASGDTVYSLSRRHGVSARAIMAANRLARPEDLRPGQKVLIPPVSWRPDSPFAVGAAEWKEPPLEQKALPAAPAGRVHVVRAGDTLNAVGRANGLSAADLARHNGIRTSDTLRIGQRLDIPASAPVRLAEASNFANDAGRPPPAAGPRRVASLETLPPPRGSLDAAPPPTARPSAAPQRQAAVSPQTVREAAKGPLPEPEPMSIGKFRWPVRGRVISQFGALPTGVRNDGINVAVPEGTSVKAAENGVVAYVGNELKGYGNLILIRHADDWVTAYAHNSQMLVKKGEQVRRGQIIAKAGQSGNVAQPQLHFELRKGSKPVDPVPYLDSTS